MNVYWIKCDLVLPARPFALSGHGYGVTAYDEADALRLLKELLTGEGIETDDGCAGFEVRSVHDISELEQNHVRPNMGNFLKRGIWYPQSTLSW